MGLVSIAEYLAQSGAHDLLKFPEINIRQELERLATELKEVESQIAAIRSTIYGLSLIYGPQVTSPEILSAARPEARKHKRGLTEACLSVLRRAPGPRSVSEVCTDVNQLHPDLLCDHRSPMASVMSVLRNLERHHRVVRDFQEGRSVWQLPAGPLRNENHGLPRAQECFQ